MQIPERSLIAFVLLTGLPVAAQVETLDPLGAQVMPGALDAPLRAGLNTWFLYQNLPQQLPVMDDFSVDRTRHRNAKPGDPDVTLDQTVYRLEVSGISTPEMRFLTDTTWIYTIDLTDPDTVIINKAANPVSVVTVRDISTFPSPSNVVDGFPPYNIFDTVGTTTPDTIGLSPDLVQDSLLVYQVAPDPRSYFYPDGSSRPYILWEDDNVLVNGTYPIDPPTVGVASFEGLSRMGLPYNTAPGSYGIADQLTSVPIDLQWPAGDSIYLSFFYQPMGLSGDGVVQPQDSLVLEFFAPNDDEWVRVWRTPYTALQPFQQVLVPIVQNRFLQTGFRMRFLNYASLCGALDHWHLDYVRLGRQRAYNDTTLVDVSYLYPESSLLQTFTSVPYRKFAENPAAYMVPSVVPLMKNLNVDRFITYGMRVGLSGEALSTYTDFPANGVNIGDNAFSTFPAAHPVNSAPNNYIYPAPAEDTCRFWRAQFYSNTTPDINRYNDTLTFIQELSNYYAYDDGSAEAGYNLNVAGAKLAVRFDTQGADSLRALRMYFDPIYAEGNPTQGSFLITVWSSLNPEVIVHQNFSFSQPSYVPWGPNRFVEYLLDSVIPVSGTFYVGYVQTNAIKMNIGFDRNRPNQDKTYYKTGMSFVNTSFPGSIMMRPVMVADKDPFAGVAEIDRQAAVHAYPNPAGDRFALQFDPAFVALCTVHLVDAMGREVRTWPGGNTWHDLSGLTDGLYVVVLRDASGTNRASTRLIVRR